MQSIVIQSITLFMTLLLLQASLWQMFKIKKEMLLLFAIFIFIPLACFLYLLVIAGASWALFLSLLLYFAIASVYVQTYPALREDTPSFRILILIDLAKKNGLSEKQIISYFEKSELFTQKMADLTSDGLVKKKNDGSFELHFFGKFLARTFRIYRSLLGLGMGEG